MSDLKKKLLDELREEITKTDMQIEELRGKIKSEMFLKSTITNGAFATAARNACDRRADAARMQLGFVEQSTFWIKEMLLKYK